MKNRTEKIFLYSGTIEESKAVIRIYTRYFKYYDSQKIRHEDDIAQLYVLTQTNSYNGKLKRKHINKQLAWNYELMCRLENAFSGKNNYLIIGMENSAYGNKILSVCTQLQMKAIRIGLFQMEIENIHQPPFQIMRQLMENFHHEKKNILSQLAKRQQQQINSITKIDLTHKVLVQNHNDQMNMIKNNFLTVVNDAKKKLKKCFGQQISKKQDKNEEKNGQIYSKREIFKIKNNVGEVKNKQQDTNEQFLSMLN